MYDHLSQVHGGLGVDPRMAHEDFGAFEEEMAINEAILGMVDLAL